MFDKVDNKVLNKALQQQNDNQLVKNNCLLCYAFGRSRSGEMLCKLEYRQKSFTYYILGTPFEVPCPSSSCPKPTSRFFFKKCKAANLI